jgi:hypothetical protein
VENGHLPALFSSGSIYDPSEQRAASQAKTDRHKEADAAYDDVFPDGYVEVTAPSAYAGVGPAVVIPAATRGLGC